MSARSDYQGGSNTLKILMKDPFNVIVAGVGGQGNIVISSLIGAALVRKGYFVVVGETYGASQRGGAVMSHVRISEETQYGPLIPDGCADIILGMEPIETLRALGQFGNPNVITIVNPRPIYPLSVLSGEAEYPDINKLLETIKDLSDKTWVINATEEAQNLGNPMFANVLLIGSLISLGMLPLDNKSLEPVLKERFPKAFEANMEAFKRGAELISQLK